jgi:hypothetical protein
LTALIAIFVGDIAALNQPGTFSFLSGEFASHREARWSVKSRQGWARGGTRQASRHFNPIKKKVRQSPTVLAMMITGALLATPYVIQSDRPAVKIPAPARDVDRNRFGRNQR